MRSAQRGGVMKLILRYHRQQPSEKFAATVRKEMETIGTMRRIDEARIRVEHREDQSPPICISAHLVTPGPDLIAKSVDHTLRAALRKVVGLIQAQLAQRAIKRGQRARDHRQRPLTAAHAF
jgi:hypothetical protein